MHFTSLVMVLLSVRLMQSAFFHTKTGRFFLMILSLGCGITAIFTCEYFVGLELARPLFLYLTIRNQTADESR